MISGRTDCENPQAYLFQRLLRSDAAQRNIRRFLGLGGQTREGELAVGDLSGRVASGE